MMKMRERERASVAPLLVVGLPAVLACATMLLSRTGTVSSLMCWDWAWTAGAFSAFAGMLLARRSAPGDSRTRWTVWAAAAACWLGGQIAWDVYGLIGFPQSPNLADLGWWGFAGLLMVGMVRSRARSRMVRIVSASETIPVVGAAVALCLAALWHDAAVSSLALAPRVAALVYPALYVSAAVVMLQAMIGGSLRASRSTALRVVLGGMVAQAVAFSLWSVQLLNQSYVPGKTLLDPLWVVGMLAIGAGGALAAHRPEVIVERHEPGRRGAILPASMFVLLLAALVDAQLSHAPAGAAITLIAGLLFCGSALVVRARLLERRLRVMLDRERAATARLAEREIELARLNARLVEDSRRDALTGMRNRRALADDLPEVAQSHEERGEPFGLALCDVDHFKAYNDRLGHLAGDQTLREIAAIVRGALRSGDLAYRFGGEELLLILRSANQPEAVAAAERVREAVETAGLSHPDGIGGAVTVSIGVAAGREEANILLARADGALYDAKHAGRNRVIAASADVAVPVVGRHRTADDGPVPRHLRSMLAVSRAAASSHGVIPVLEALAETIRVELSFQVVAVNLLDVAHDMLRCVVALGDDDAREALLGTENPWGEWKDLMHSEHQRGGAVWLPAGSYDWSHETVLWTPAALPVPDPDAWLPDDMLLLPLRGRNGEASAVVSLDQPLDGRRPDDEQLSFLMAVADHAGLALEQAQRDVDQTATLHEQSSELRLAAVILLAEALDLRDPGTSRHSRAVGEYARQMAMALGLRPDRVERIHSAGVVHDLGKLGITDAILHKPGPLTGAEWQEIHKHPEIGARILEHAGLREMAAWVRTHHERIDGRGYPSGLTASEIPLEARILAVADAYEAMTADRPYRPAMPAAEARQELLRCSGTQFDPVAVDALISTLESMSTSPAQPMPRAA
jgi:diguanylate cyclase (GGDEF)-like protein